jgi:hypothetical protein
MSNIQEREYKIGNVFYVSFVDSTPSNIIVKYIIKDIKQKNATIYYITDVYTFNEYRGGAEFESWWFDSLNIYTTFSEAKKDITNRLAVWAEIETKALQESIDNKKHTIENIMEF